MLRTADVSHPTHDDREGALEDEDVIEERSTRLLDQLERRAATLLGTLRESRVQQEALHSRLAGLERRRAELEALNAELAVAVRDEQAGREALAQRCSRLEARLAELEATRLELAEENRELDEQNRELEAHNRRLLEREPAKPGASLFHRQARRGQGLSALIGPRPQQPDPGEVASAPPAPASPVTPPVPDPALEGAEPAPGASEPSEPLSDPGAPPPDDPPTPQALLEQWYQRYASTFFKGHTRPLQVGIHEALTAREPWSEKLVRRALACYVNLPRYLKSVREGAERLDLAGEPAGQVDAAAAEHARKKLERLQADRRQRGRPARQAARHPDPAKGGTAQGDKLKEGTRKEEMPRQETRKGGKRRGEATRHQAAKPGTHAPPQQPAVSLGGGQHASPNREPATLEEKLSALLAKHNQR